MTIINHGQRKLDILDRYATGACLFPTKLIEKLSEAGSRMMNLLKSFHLTKKHYDKEYVRVLRTCHSLAKEEAHRLWNDGRAKGRVHTLEPS